MKYQKSDWSEVGEKPRCAGVWETVDNWKIVSYNYWDGNKYGPSCATIREAYKTRSDYKLCGDYWRFRGIVR